MEKTSRKLLLAILTIAVCLALLVAGTYALFSTQFGVENHLVAGNLSATLVRDKLVSVTLGDNGHLTSTTNEDDKDFTKAGTDNLFDITDGVKIAPECSFTADMILTNTGSVAFSYWIEVKLKGTSNELAQQLKVTVTEGTNVTTKSLSEGLTVGSEASGIGVVDVNGKANFSVKVEFENLSTNNAAQNQSVDFDFVVYAIQYAVH